VGRHLAISESLDGQKGRGKINLLTLSSGVETLTFSGPWTLECQLLRPLDSGTYSRSPQISRFLLQSESDSFGLLASEALQLRLNFPWFSSLQTAAFYLGHYVFFLLDNVIANVKISEKKMQILDLS
jgi:hypothetical protein